MLIISLLLLASCASATHRSDMAESGQSDISAGNRSGVVASEADSQAKHDSPTMQQVSLHQVDQSQSIAEAMNRKIIRNADLALEVLHRSKRSKSQLIAEALGGFVVNSSRN